MEGFDSYQFRSALNASAWLFSESKCVLLVEPLL